MKTLKKMVVVLVCTALMSVTVSSLAEDQPAQGGEDEQQIKLAKESEEAAAASATTKPTPEMIMEKVNKAAAMLEAEGIEGFKKLQGADSEYIFAGTYIWVHDLKGIMRMHPIKYKLNGKPILGMKDSDGTLFFVEMNKVAGSEKGAGWVCYMWPKPGEKETSKKISYVKYCKTKDGDELVLGCGVYDMTPEQMKSLIESNSK